MNSKKTPKILWTDYRLNIYNVGTLVFDNKKSIISQDTVDKDSVYGCVYIAQDSATTVKIVEWPCLIVAKKLSCNGEL